MAGSNASRAPAMRSDVDERTRTPALCDQRTVISEAAAYGGVVSLGPLVARRLSSTRFLAAARGKSRFCQPPRASFGAAHGGTWPSPADGRRGRCACGSCAAGGRCTATCVVRRRPHREPADGTVVAAGRSHTLRDLLRGGRCGQRPLLGSIYPTYFAPTSERLRKGTYNVYVLGHDGRCQSCPPYERSNSLTLVIPAVEPTLRSVKMFSVQRGALRSAATLGLCDSLGEGRPAFAS